MTANKRAIGSDLAKVDAHEIQPEEYEEIPELTDEWLDQAEHFVGNTFVPRKRPGRPPSEHPKEQVTLRLDADVIEHFRAAGPGWQTRINAALRELLPRGKSNKAQRPSTTRPPGRRAAARAGAALREPLPRGKRRSTTRPSGS